MKRIIYFIFFLHALLWGNTKSWDAVYFEELSNDDRYNYVHQFEYWKIKNPDSLAFIFREMMDRTDRASDIKSSIAIRYYCTFSILTPGFKIPNNKTPEILLTEMFNLSTEHGYKTDALIANYYLKDLQHTKDSKNYTSNQYTVITSTYEQMKSIGFDKFHHYSPEVLLYNMGKFMWDIKDYHLAYTYFEQAEHFIKPTTKGALYYTLVLNHLQEYWLQKKNFDKSIIYAKRLLAFHNNQPYSIPPHSLWWKNFWQMFTHLNIAKLHIKKGEFESGMKHAKQSLSFSRQRAEGSEIPTALMAEFEAIAVLLHINIEFNKTDRISKLSEQALSIRQKLKRTNQFDEKKALPFYQNLYAYYNKNKNPELALEYLEKVNRIKDSTTAHNNHIGILHAQQKADAFQREQIITKANRDKLIQRLLIVLLCSLLCIGIYSTSKYMSWNKKNKKVKQYKINKVNKKLTELSHEIDSTFQKSKEIETKYQILQNKKQEEEIWSELKTMTVLTTEDWTVFKLEFEKLFPEFISNVKVKYPSITKAELRLLVFEKLNLNTDEMANKLGVNKNTIHQTRRRFRKKTETLEEV